MKRTVLLGSCLAFALGTAACQDQPTAPASPDAGAEFTLKSVDPANINLDRGPLAVAAPGRMTDQRLAEAVQRAINPGDYVCSSTAIVDWYVDAFNQLAAEELEALIFLYLQVWADYVPLYEAAYLMTDETPQSFGYEGQYTNVMTRTHRDTKRFWDIYSDDIQLLAMKGSMLLDVDRVAAVYQLPYMPPFYGLSEADAYFVANLIRDYVLESNLLDGGNHPLFSFNAFAISGGGIPDKIVMGDGILAGYEFLGFEDVAAQAIYAHEFAHHIQFENDYFSDPYATTGTGAERTRYTELMADAMSAYYLTHKRGAALNKHRVAEFLQVFYEIGDCSFASSGHHGTPNQRMAAAQFGFDLADATQKKGQILTSEEFHTLFVAAYPGLIAPDAP